MNKVTMLEPIAWLVEWTPGDKTWVQAHADEVTARDQSARQNGRVSELITTSQAETYANARVREALEQAAAIADHQHFGGANDDDLSWTDCAATIAASIRALIARSAGES